MPVPKKSTERLVDCPLEFKILQKGTTNENHKRIYSK